MEITIQTDHGEKEVEAELYKGYGINRTLGTEDYFYSITCIKGNFKGYSILNYLTKDEAKKVIDEIVNEIGFEVITGENKSKVTKVAKRYSLVVENGTEIMRIV